MPPGIIIGPSLDWAPQYMRGVLRGDEVFNVPTVAGVELHPDLDRAALQGLSIDEILQRAEGEGGQQLLKAPNGERAHLRIVASTNNLVRDNGIVPIEAWESNLDVWLTNPVVAFAHMGGFLGGASAPEVKMPIGRAVDTRLSTRQGRMDQWWLFNDVTDVSRQVHALFILGDMKAASVGFIIHEFHRATEEDRAKHRKKHPRINEFTFIVDEAELVETSAVAIGSDPKALSVGTARSLFQGADFERMALGRQAPVRDEPPGSDIVRGLTSIPAAWNGAGVEVDIFSQQFAAQVLEVERLLGEPLDAIRRQFRRVMRPVGGDEAGAEALAVDDLVSLVVHAEAMAANRETPAYQSLALAAELYWEFQDQHHRVLERLGAEELIARAQRAIQQARTIKVVPGPRTITVSTPHGA